MTIFVVVYTVMFFHYFDVESQQTSLILKNIIRIELYMHLAYDKGKTIFDVTRP